MKIKLEVYSSEREKIGCMFMKNGQIEFSPDTDEYLREGILDLVNTRRSVAYSDKNGHLVRRQLFGHSVKTLRVLKDLLHYTLACETRLVQRASKPRTSVKAKDHFI